MLVFILMVSIGGQVVSRDCDEALCWKDIDRCLYFAERLNQQSQAPEIEAYCMPLNASDDARWYK